MEKKFYEYIKKDTLFIVIPLLLSYNITIYIGTTYKINNTYLSILFAVLSIVIMLFNFSIYKMLKNR